MIIHLKNFIGQYLISYEDSLKLCRKIEDNILLGNKVELDLKDVIGVACFYNFLFSELYKNFSIEKINEYVSFININEIEKKIINFCKNHIIKYMTDENYKNAIDEFHRNEFNDK